MDKKKTRAVKKYDVARSKKLGRYMVASKDMSAGEVILKESASAVGLSSVYEPSSVFCFGCMRPMQLHLQPSATCSGCAVALACTKRCETSGQHSEAECKLFRTNPNLYLDNLKDLVGALLHLRLWLLKDTEEIWSKIWSLESHLNERRNTPVWKDRQRNIVQVFRKFGLADDSLTSEETIQRLCGIVDVNTFELRPPSVGCPSWESGVPLLRGLFPEASLMAHACRANAHITVDEDFTMNIHAAVPIKAGDTITFNYTSSLLGTAERQEHLQEGKYFRCECEVCRDPLEGGSYLSCIVCPRCRRDYVAIQKPTSLLPYDAKTKWQCQKCKRIYRGCLLKSTLDIAKALVSQVDHEDLKSLETLLDKFYQTFHKHHFVMLSLKHKILALYRREVTTVNPQRKVLHKMLQICREMLELLEIVEPGISRLKGIMLYEMQVPMSLLASREYAAREINEEQLLAKLVESQGYLRRALKILLLEPVNTPEGFLAKRALMDLKVLTQNIEDVKAMPARLEESRHQHQRNRWKKKTKSK